MCAHAVAAHAHAHGRVSRARARRAGGHAGPRLRGTRAERGAGAARVAQPNGCTCPVACQRRGGHGSNTLHGQASGLSAISQSSPISHDFRKSEIGIHDADFVFRSGGWHWLENGGTWRQHRCYQLLNAQCRPTCPQSLFSPGARGGRPGRVPRDCHGLQRVGQGAWCERQRE